MLFNASIFNSVTKDSMVDEVVGRVPEVEPLRRVGVRNLQLFKILLQPDGCSFEVINLEMCRVKPADEKYKRGTGKWGLQFDEGSTVSVLKSGQVLAPDEAPVREFLKCTMDELVEVPDGTMIELTDCFIKVTPRLVKNRRSGHTLRGSITNGGIMMGMVSEIEKFVVAMLEKRKPIGVKGRFRGDEIIINYATENSYP
ncbi:hypothetical protein M3Y98_00631200 [Aphelenchoides besseyi]|nr:hypothetical protein M3Y98_00631200 [Aphelenchoides besseyi]